MLALNLGILGFNLLLSLSETFTAKELVPVKAVKNKHFNFSVGNLVETNKSSTIRKVEKNENIFLTLKIYADKQYDHDQNIYLAEGNVKALINNGVLRSDFLSYDKSTGILSAVGNISFRKGGQYFIAKEFKFNLLKRKGVIILVGAVPIEIPREPNFYRKELEFKISTSYGPGRYDVKYEEEGRDYPFAYVRWTEQRNMQAFLELISNGYLNLKPLISHVFDIEDAKKAYDMVLGKDKTGFIGILLKYGESAKQSKTFVSINKTPNSDINIGIIGAGSFAQSYLLPYAKGLANFDTVVTRTGVNSKNVAQKFSFNTSSTSAADIFNNKSINSVFIATRHNTHSEYVVGALKSKKHVFVEKPLAMSYDELDAIIREYRKSEQILMVGFNRRFAPISLRLKDEFKNIGEPLVMNFSINAGFIPKEHWSQTDAGGGRIIGEMCHFIDLMQYLMILLK